MTTVSTLLKSCATPPARRPIASIFWSWHLALALAQNGVRPLPLRDVPAHAGETAHPAVLVCERGARPLVGRQGAVGAAQATLDLEWLVFEARGQRRPARLAVVFSQQVHQPRAPPVLPASAARAL